MDSKYKIPKKGKKRQQILRLFYQENVWGKSRLHGFLGYTVGDHGITKNYKQNLGVCGDIGYAVDNLGNTNS